ncbi:hypothetical protein [Haladaptatus caseinilyticus]|uniref:hypothetical protein n=1 Tax=Haladaptatus caseinilyticus TaxID=2993314 RepID=UPI00224B98D1|nr:hypothetical protein [Haladaptatus caseinilyticus]
MADTKKGRNKQARNADNRQREWEMQQARERSEESEPRRDDRDETPAEGDRYPNPTRECHRRGCNETASFVVLERYQEETGHGAVEAEVFLCREHTREESPANLDGVYADYVFRVEPIPEIMDAGTE